MPHVFVEHSSVAVGDIQPSKQRACSVSHCHGSDVAVSAHAISDRVQKFLKDCAVLSKKGKNIVNGVRNKHFVAFSIKDLFDNV